MPTQVKKQQSFGPRTKTQEPPVQPPVQEPPVQPPAQPPAQEPPMQLSDHDVERAAREAEKRTKEAISETPLVPIWIDPVIGMEGEMLTYRLNGVTYHVRTKQVVNVPQALAEVILDQASRKKLSARDMREYLTDPGMFMGELT